MAIVDESENLTPGGVVVVVVVVAVVDDWCTERGVDKLRLL